VAFFALSQIVKYSKLVSFVSDIQTVSLSSFEARELKISSNLLNSQGDM